MFWFAFLALAGQTYEVQGRLVPEHQAAIYLHDSRSPFAVNVITDMRGRFRFTRIPAGTYTVGVFIPARGDMQVTVDIGPSQADSKGRVKLEIPIDESKLRAESRHTVSARDLAVQEKARKAYREAEQRLAANDTAGAIAQLERAVEISPGFATAWNHLGTIAYQTQRYPDAEKYFRRALEADPEAYAPLVNLGGVLLNLGKVEEAWKYNTYAVLKQPRDALANSQLGMTYIARGNVELAEKHLLEAVRIDPGHFSHPQLHLAEIYARGKQYRKAAAQLEDFLKHHPDSPQAAKLQEAIAAWKSEP
jgi:tetratricopeptide (TPR) repeat protein